MDRKVIGLMFGCSYATIINLMKKCGYSYPAVRGKRFAQYHDDWRNFFSRDERFANLMDSFDKAEKPAEESSEKQAEESQGTLEETTQTSVQESAKKTPEIMSMSIRIYADSYDELISQLESMRGQPIMGKTLTIEVIKG